MDNAPRTHAVLGMVLSMLMCVGGAATTAIVSASEDDRTSIDIPLVSGRVNAVELLAPVCSRLGIDAGTALEPLDWTIDTSSILGRLQLGLIERATDGIVAAHVGEDRLTISYDGDALEAKRLELEPRIRALMGRFTGKGGTSPANAPREYGIFMLLPDGGRESIATVADVPARVVLLVHGLDDPGGMFDDLIPMLHKVGHVVAQLDYPNDGPIGESADLLAAQLIKLRALGAAHVDIIAKSMGGLVTRDVLTRPAHYGGDGRGGDELPAVDRFIMVGTPNHGSQMARFRVLLELGEHLPGIFRGDLDSATSDLDGRGEAGIDLLPGSTFLRRLNERPIATHTRHTIIAGRISPIDPSDVKRWLDRMRKAADVDSAPGGLRSLMTDDSADAANKLVESTVNCLGDGLVTIESARLDGVDDFVLVSGNHLSMIIDFDDEALPPAIPIILDRLGRE